MRRSVFGPKWGSGCPDESVSQKHLFGLSAASGKNSNRPRLMMSEYVLPSSNCSFLGAGRYALLTPLFSELSNSWGPSWNWWEKQEVLWITKQTKRQTTLENHLSEYIGTGGCLELKCSAKWNNTIGIVWMHSKYLWILLFDYVKIQLKYCKFLIIFPRLPTLITYWNGFHSSSWLQCSWSFWTFRWRWIYGWCTLSFADVMIMLKKSEPRLLHLFLGSLRGTNGGGRELTLTWFHKLLG